MTRLHCLHGSFQAPEVWTGLAERLPTFEVVAESILPPERGGLAAWADAFCRRTGPTGLPRALLGYSLGGRLAMHALVRCPGTWTAAVLVAAHPGPTGAAERTAIRERDAAWASRCRSEPLEALLADWDALPVFGGRPNRAPRPPDALDPERQARILEAFSRAGQEDLRDALASVDLPPVLYVTGGEDRRYGELGDELARRIPSLRHSVVPDAGHRAPWDRPEAFAELVSRFLADP